MPEDGHLLSAAPRLWLQMRGEFDTCPADATLAEDGGGVPSDELKKLAKWLQHSVTKFGASAAVADGPDRDRALAPIADEVIKALTAAIGTLLSLKRGAGNALLAELRNTGSGLAAALDELGQAVGSPSMARCAGQVLDKVKQLERTSTHNRAAIRRQLLLNLSHLRDAHRELQEALTSGGEAEEDDDDEDDFGDLDASLEPAERRLVEALVELVAVVVEVLKRVSSACVAPKQGDGEAVAISVLEVAAAHASTASSAMDGLSVAASGGLDAKEFTKSMAEMKGAVAGLMSSPSGAEDTQLPKAMEAVEVAFAAAVAEDEGAAGK